MRFYIVFILSIILYNHSCCGQSKAKITDVDFHFFDRYIVVNYNLVGSLPKEQMTVELKFITENNETIIPKTVTGDIGTKLYGDGMKSILWDLVVDKVSLSGNIKASVTITFSKILYSGPSNALLSVLLPGFGGLFVDKNKTRSVVTTVSTIGLIGYGISQKRLADKYYAEYKASEESSELESLYTKANSAHHKYYISTGIAAGIWAFDIIWVTVKGFHNKKGANSSYGSFTGDGLRLNYVNNGLQLKYSVSF